MSFAEIIQRLVNRDPAVTECFFFWEGLTIDQIEEIRRKDPERATKMKRPVCNTCRPALLRILSRLYNGGTFDYREKVNELYLYMMEDNKLAQIKDPACLMAWIATTARNFFLKRRGKEMENDSNLLDNDNDITLKGERCDTESDKKKEVRQLVSDTLAIMPNKTDVKILEAAMDFLQYSKAEKIAKKKEVIARLGMSEASFNMAYSRAKRNFKKIALKQ